MSDYSAMYVVGRTIVKPIKTIFDHDSTTLYGSQNEVACKQKTSSRSFQTSLEFSPSHANVIRRSHSQLHSGCLDNDTANQFERPDGLKSHNAILKSCTP